MTVVDASLPLQKAVLAALKAHTALTAIVSGRIYDNVPAGATLPYVSFGPFDVLTENLDEYEGSDTTIQIDGWSGGGANVGSVQVKQMGRYIREALNNAELALDENQRLVLMTVEVVRYLREPDGITQHVAVTVRARTEPIV